MDGWPAAIPLEGIGVVGLVLLFGIGLATNRLYTRGQVAAIEAAHAEQIKALNEAHEREVTRLIAATAREVEDANHERNEWRTEARLEHQTVVELTDQNRMLKAFGETLADFLDSMRALAGMRRAEERDPA